MKLGLTTMQNNIERWFRALFYQKWIKNYHRLPPFLLSDKKYAKNRFQTTFGRPLNLKNPVTFNEKIQWIKLYDRRPIMTKLADKYEVREYVKEKIGSQYLNPLHGVYERYEDFAADIPNLPIEFILKATHGCGWNQIINNKETISSMDSQIVKSWLSENYYYKGREWVYKNIKPRIVCESLIQPLDQRQSLTDYKFYCFHGEPLFIAVNLDRYVSLRRNIFSLSWEKLSFTLGPPGSEKPIPKPDSLDEMISIAKSLSKEFAFMRVDLYSEKTVVFGECTFYPTSGFGKFKPETYDNIYGNQLHLPLVRLSPSR